MSDQPPVHPPVQSGLSIYRRLLSYVKPHRKVFLISLLGMVVLAGTEAGFAYLMKPIMDSGFVNHDPVSVRTIPLYLIALFLLRGLASYASSFGMQWVGRGVIADMRAQLFSHYLQLPAGYFDQRNSGDLISVITFNIEQVAIAITNAITILVRDSLTALALLGLMFYHSGLLTLTVLLIGPIVGLVIYKISHRYRKISKNVQHSMGTVTHITQEVIDGQRVVKTFGGHDYERHRFDEVNQNNRQQYLKMTSTQSISVSFVQFLAATVLAAIIYMATRDEASSIATPGAFISFITAMLLLMPTLKRLTTVNQSLQRGITAAESVFEILDTDPEPDKGTKQLGRVRGVVQYQNIDFTYSGSHERVLKDICFKMSAGETVAIVGRSGSGKSTLVNLLPRFYDSTKGKILVDGHNIHDYSLFDLREQISLVSQHVTLFNDTVARNIDYGQLEQTDESRIIAAAEAAHAMEFIRELPDGIHTLVGEDGLNLSGGQRQRLAIARALLKNAPILILDEATSALDTESERLVQQGLEELMENRTTLVIAHRLSTVEKADRILVLDSGQLVESGTHTELLEKNGHYAALYRMQFQDD
ncbi:MAG TPA: lipid A export permease/ATP-binding protein MsbA [Gammaproteobacteria bacterium]|nr:lipid A export permease/ATP-binding protein MsbA [Gammaproteobacteria bacterium]